MHGFEEHHQSIGLGAVIEAGGPFGCQLHDEAEDDVPQVTEVFLIDVLTAVAGMAMRSKRRQADLDAALRNAGVECERPRRMAALERLRTGGYVDRVVELSDGGVLLSVTAAGLDRLGGARHR